MRSDNSFRLAPPLGASHRSPSHSEASVSPSWEWAGHTRTKMLVPAPNPLRMAGNVELGCMFRLLLLADGRPSSSLSPVSQPEILLSPPRAWVEIDTNNLRNNLTFAQESSGCEVMAVVKAGAYGHGLEDISRIFEACGVAFLGVANIGEARRIREAGATAPIYLLGASWAGEREEIVARQIVPCVSSIEEGRAFNQIAKAQGVLLPVHLAVDTGMGRGGFLATEIIASFQELERLESLRIEGIASHLSSADEDPAYTELQIEAFEAAVASLGGESRFKWRHLSNSGGLLGFPRGCCNLARPGLMLYGISPIPLYQEKLRNVMTLKSRVTLVRTLPAGHSVSYGRSYVTSRPTRVATVGIGYGDGYPRQVSGKGAEVFIAGKRHPVLGRVTMDQIMVGLPDESDIANGDEVEIFGPNISAQEVARWAETIPWEIFTGITPRVQRIYIGDRRE